MSNVCGTHTSNIHFTEPNHYSNISHRASTDTFADATQNDNMPGHSKMAGTSAMKDNFSICQLREKIHREENHN